MYRKNGTCVLNIVQITSGDIDFIENYADDLYPHSVWIDAYRIEHYKEIVDFLKNGYEKELEMLQKDEIDYIVVDYDM